MGSSMCPFMSVRLLFFLPMFHFLNSCSSFSTQPLCNDSERSALLQFKQSFVINMSVSSDPFAYPKLSSWKSGDRNDCCSWDGVQCDGGTGHVIGLDLSSSYLYGSINSSSSLFHLVHLQMLNLADNNFNYSQIPQSIRYLSNLTYLNLAFSVFADQIPREILELSKLENLALTGNEFLKLQQPGLKSLVENLTSLKDLYLGFVNISSTLPHILGNLSSLTSLGLTSCGLFGEFPIEIFKLPNLEILIVRDNENLSGYLPEFHSNSPLQILRLANTSFSGKLPDSIGNLKSLYELNIAYCDFSGLLPTSLGNLTKLTVLGLTHTNSYGEIPSFLKNLSQLTELHLGRNHLTGQIPSWLGNLTQLTLLDLGSNKLHGSIPQSVSRLVNLESLDMMNNNLSGRVEFDLFLKLKNLTNLQLSGVHLSFPINSTFNTSIPNLKQLTLEECNLTEFPIFLRYQHELEYLELGGNQIRGQIPKWIFNVGKKTLLYFSLGSNFLTGFESFSHTPVILPWDSLLILDLNSNKLQGSLPIPTPSIAQYIVSNNKLTGEISPLFCKLSSIILLDLAHNNLSGMLPQCLSKLSDLLVLNLRNNNFHGTLPATYVEQSRLKAIDVSYNQFEGQVPRSLSNCTLLEILVLGNNWFHDIFPSWLGKLPRLRVLILRSNGFHGTIGKPESKLDFAKLQIIDISFNNFTGKLLSEHFQSWTSMKVSNLTYERDTVYNSTYMDALTTTSSSDFIWYGHFSYSVEMTNKGIEMKYEKIQDIFRAIDFSSNRFYGKIPEIIGNLKGLHLLNLSNNILTGCIPSSLGNLIELEALDLSQNKLSGKIPQQLLKLTFLEFFNVSNNYLTGPIPQGQQFSTFQNDSYLGNTGLCGSPLIIKCKNYETLTQPLLNSRKGEDSNFPSKSDWVVIMMGYGSGFIVGFIIGHNLKIRKFEQFVKNLRRRQEK